MLKLVSYNPSFKERWDNLVANSRNGTFLFYRDYMDYHSDRFRDCSFLVLKKDNVEAVIPGNIDRNCFYSHQGLTYGGLVSSNRIHTEEVIKIFTLLNKELVKRNVKEIVYKPVPLIYHRIPAQEDIYALFLNKAEKTGCNISSSIYQVSKSGFNESRRSGLRKSKRNNIQVSESTDFSEFWKILEKRLSGKFKTRPIHTLKEIKLLNSKFPDNIKLFVAKLDKCIVAGSVLYIMKNVVHVQYISANEKGEQAGALDAIFDVLVNKVFSHIPVFDFGPSTERIGNILNRNLIFQKEGFGGRGVVYETYRYRLH